MAAVCTDIFINYYFILMASLKINFKTFFSSTEVLKNKDAILITILAVFNIYKVHICGKLIKLHKEFK